MHLIQEISLLLTLRLLKVFSQKTLLKWAHILASLQASSEIPFVKQQLKS